ncbi:MAG: hypothetical protein ACLS4A_08510 [Oscillospiraceae bacterium]
MNILKKVLCVVLCIIMVQSFAISGFAAEASVPAEDPDADSFLPLIRESQEWTPMAVLPFRSIPA